jgi:predicted alpha/beta superfamily hydrolase
MKMLQKDILNTPLPIVSTGRIERLENIRSDYVSSRHIDVWLPEGYPSRGKYAVLYMNDGQMLFDSATTWNGQSWGVAETVGELSSTGKIRNCIVVAIWNSGGNRHSDYFPQKPFEHLPAAYRESLKEAKREDGTTLFPIAIRSDDYLKFITKELKPFIDCRYATLPDLASTFIAGSSMGGMISIYAVCEYPEIFCGAACMSTHWLGIFTEKNNPIPDAFFSYLYQSLPSPKDHRFYFDYGTETLDAFYAPYQLKVDQIMISKGYTSKNWQTRKFIGEEHSENAWRKRLHIPITFLLRVE